jgi:putative endonuclease
MMAAYMLRCSDGSYYVGSSRNLDHRMMQHATGRGAAYTSTRMPVELVWFEEFHRIDEAYAREKQVQGWSRAKREALIEGRIADLEALAKKRFG